MSEVKTYREKLLDPRWQKLRLEIMQRAKFACEACASNSRTLEVHHGAYFRDKEPWEIDSMYLWCLCTDCHKRAQKTLVETKALLGLLPPRGVSMIHGIITVLRSHVRGARKP